MRSPSPAAMVSPPMSTLGSRTAKGDRPTNTRSRKAAKANSRRRDVMSCPALASRMAIPSLAMNYGILFVGPPAHRRQFAERAVEFAQGPDAAIRIESEDDEQHGVQQECGHDPRHLIKLRRKAGAIAQEHAHVRITRAVGTA